VGKLGSAACTTYTDRLAKVFERMAEVIMHSILVKKKKAADFLSAAFM